MRKVITGGIAVTLGVSTALAAGAFAGGNGAQRASLAANPGGQPMQCSESGGGSNGFAIVNGPGKPAMIKFINGEVHLVGGQPSTLYTIVVEPMGTTNCDNMAGTLKTNGQGIGNGHINFATTAAGSYYVALLDGGGTQQFSTNDVTIN